MDTDRIDDPVETERFKLMTILAKLVSSTTTAAQRCERELDKMRTKPESHPASAGTGAAAGEASSSLSLNHKEPAGPTDAVPMITTTDPFPPTNVIASLSRLVTERTGDGARRKKSRRRRRNQVTPTAHIPSWQHHLLQPTPQQHQQLDTFVVTPESESVNTHVCRYCGQIFDEYLKLAAHHRRIHEKPYKCKWCDVLFSTKSLMKRHTNLYHLHLEKMAAAASLKLTHTKRNSTHQKEDGGTVPITTQQRVNPAFNAEAADDQDEETQILYESTKTPSHFNGVAATARPSSILCDQSGGAPTGFNNGMGKCVCVQCQKVSTRGHNRRSPLERNPQQPPPSQPSPRGAEEQHQNGGMNFNSSQIFTARSVSSYSGGMMIENQIPSASPAPAMRPQGLEETPRL